MSSATRTRKLYKRVKFEFWLDVYNAHQANLADQLAYLKLERQYSATLRDALTLLFDLQAGGTDELYRMFPHLRPTSASDDFAALVEKIDQIARRPQPGPQALQPIAKRDAASVTPTDDDLAELEIKNDSQGKVAAQNLINSMYSLNPHLRTKDTIQPSGPSKLAGADVSFSAPNFNDVEDLDLLS